MFRSFVAAHPIEKVEETRKKQKPTIGQMRMENQAAGGNMALVMEALKIPQSAIEAVKGIALH